LLLTDEFHRKLHNVPKKPEKQKLNYEEKMVCYLCFWRGIFFWNNISNTNKNNTAGNGNSPPIYKNKI
jgi:hypothetical protein